MHLQINYSVAGLKTIVFCKPVTLFFWVQANNSFPSGNLIYKGIHKQNRVHPLTNSGWRLFSRSRHLHSTAPGKPVLTVKPLFRQSNTNLYLLPWLQYPVEVIFAQPFITQIRQSEITRCKPAFTAGSEKKQLLGEIAAIHRPAY